MLEHSRVRLVFNSNRYTVAEVRQPIDEHAGWFVVRSDTFIYDEQSAISINRITSNEDLNSLLRAVSRFHFILVQIEGIDYGHEDEQYANVNVCFLPPFCDELRLDSIGNQQLPALPNTLKKLSIYDLNFLLYLPTDLPSTMVDITIGSFSKRLVTPQRWRIPFGVEIVFIHSLHTLEKAGAELENIIHLEHGSRTRVCVLGPIPTSEWTKRCRQKSTDQRRIGRVMSRVLPSDVVRDFVMQF